MQEIVQAIEAALQLISVLLEFYREAVGWTLACLGHYRCSFDYRWCVNGKLRLNVVSIVH